MNGPRFVLGDIVLFRPIYGKPGAAEIGSVIKAPFSGLYFYNVRMLDGSRAIGLIPEDSLMHIPPLVQLAETSE